MKVDFLEALKNILFPPLCFVCGRRIQEGIICPWCFEKIEFLKPPLCRLCSLPLNGAKSSLCRSCQKKDFSYYERIISIVWYKEPIITLLHLFKYYYQQFLKDFFSSLMVKHLKDIGFDFNRFDVIVAVPSHPARVKERDYNQARILAESLASKVSLSYRNDILSCILPHRSQTRLLPHQRWKNVEGIFKASNVEEKRIILIDDVFTTGATITECSKALKEKGAKEIVAVTLAKAR